MKTCTVETVNGYLINVNGGNILTAAEYIDLTVKETWTAWAALDIAEKADYNFNFQQFYNSYNEIDRDFLFCDSDGNILPSEDQYYSDDALSYLSSVTAI